MGFAKYASMQVLEVECETAMSRTATAAGIQRSPDFEVLQTEAGKTAHRATFEYARRPGYIYVRSRAISSRTNDNYDDFPAEEIEKSYRTFIGKPVFVNHHNDDHRRARGVCIDAALHRDTNPNGTPDTWVEVLMEVDARRFPVLAREIGKGNIARTSMGTNVEYSICTACGNKAYSPVEYCQHIPRMKGMKIRRAKASGGGQEEVLIAERCYGLGFFENSLLVEDPADPTAYVLGVEGDGISSTAGVFRDIADDVSRTYRGVPTKPTREHERQEERDRINDWADSMKRFVDEDDEESGLRHHSIRTLFDQVIVPREAITTWHPDPGDVIANEIRAAMKEAKSKDTPVSPSEHGDPRMQDAGVSVSKTKSGQYYVHTHRARSKYYDSVSAIPQKDIDFIRSTGFRYDTQHVPYQHDYAGTQPHTTEEAIPAGSSITDLHNEHAKGYGQGSTEHMQQGQDKADRDVKRQHRQLWKQHHPGQPFQGVRVVEASACAQCNPGHGLHEGLLCGTHAHMTFLRTLHGQDAFDSAIFNNPRPQDSDMWATAVGPHFWDDGAQIVWQQDHLAGEHDGKPQVGCRLCFPLTSEQQAQVEQIMDGLSDVRRGEPGIYDQAKTSVNEVKAPTQVDTMRAERCPVCQDDEAYDGDRCGICGYVAPPEMFQDPDLDKAQQVDLRQDQMEQVDDEGNLAVDTADVEGQGGILTCDACGEEFGPDAEGQDAPDDGPAPATDEAAQADPDSAGDPTQQDGTAAPDDLSDLADKTDEELGVGDDEIGPDAQEDPQQAESPVEQDPAPAADPSGIAPDDQASLEDTDSVDKGDVCPICGQGTIVSIQPASTDPAADPKEKSRDMTQQQQDPQKKQPPVNPAKHARNRLVAVILGQQRVIEGQQHQITALRDFVLEIGTAAGLDNHPRFAALRKSADDTNQTPETTPATTSGDAKTPDAKDDPQNVGAAPDGANVNVTPQAVTDVSSTDKVEPGQPPLSNLVDVTAPTPGANNVPAAGDGDKVINPVTIGTPSTDTMDPAGSSGWKSSAKSEDPMERHTASLRLARLRIAAGLARGEDLAIGEAISKDASLSLDTIKALSAELSQTISAQQASAPTRQQAQRLVPRAAGNARPPSLATAPEEGFDVTASTDGGMDQWMVGLDSLGGE